MTFTGPRPAPGHDISPPSNPHGITVARSAHRDRPLNKTQRFQDGEWKPALTFKDPRWFRYDTRAVATLRELGDLIEEVQSDPNACILRGEPTDAVRNASTETTFRRLLHPKKQADTGEEIPATLIELPRFWVCIDVDDFTLPPELHHDREGAVRCAIERCLPSSFHDADCFFQFSSSAGIKPDRFKAHLWFWLSEPHSSADLKKALASEITRGAVDARVFSAAQIHYISRPVIEGAPDPCPERTGFLARGSRCVELEAAPLAPATEPRRRASPTAPDRGDLGTARFLAEIRPGHVHPPVISACMAYANRVVTGRAPRDDEALKDEIRAAIPANIPEAVARTDDYLDKAIQSAIGKIEMEGRAWQAKLKRNDNGVPFPSVTNAQTALHEAPEWKGVLRFNEMTCKVELHNPPFRFAVASEAGREIRDSDATHAAVWFEEHGLRYGHEAICRALVAEAENNPYHPVRNYLRGLKWDGKPRADRFLVDYFGGTDNSFNRAVGGRFLIGAVARVMSPGCKNDQVLIVEGEQGIGKSHGFALLFGAEYFTDSIEDLGGKDTMEATQGMWCVELGELTALKGKSLERAKAYITSQKDRYRPSYGRFSADHLRQFVIVGTHNPDGADYMGDTSGNRRFVVAKSDRGVDKTAIVRDRDQLWAEALARFEAGERWWLDRQLDPELVAEQSAVNEARQETDPWTMRLGPWLAEQEGPIPCVEVNAYAVRTVSRVYGSAGNADSETVHDRSPTLMDAKRVAKAMHVLGWAKQTARVAGLPVKSWVRTEKAEPYRAPPDPDAAPY